MLQGFATSHEAPASGAVKFTTHDLALAPRECFALAPRADGAHAWRVLSGAPRCDIPGQSDPETAVAAFGVGPQALERALRRQPWGPPRPAGHAPSCSDEVHRHVNA